MQPLNFNATPAERKTPCYPFVTSGPILILKSLCSVASLTVLDSKLGGDPLYVLQKDVVALPLMAAGSNLSASQRRLPLLPHVKATHSRPNLF